MRRASCGHLLCGGRLCAFNGTPLLIQEVAPRNWMRPLIAVVVGVMIGLLLSSCAPSQAQVNRMVDARIREVAGMVQTAKPLRVELVNPIDCAIDDLGEAPEDPVWPTADEDYYRRQYVHRGDYAKTIEYQHDVGMVLGQIAKCLVTLGARH